MQHRRSQLVLPKFSLIKYFDLSLLDLIIYIGLRIGLLIYSSELISKLIST